MFGALRALAGRGLPKNAREPIHGGLARAIRPPWMAGVSRMQEQFIDHAANTLLIPYLTSHSSSASLIF
jgi:hypothetical protein